MSRSAAPPTSDTRHRASPATTVTSAVSLVLLFALGMTFSFMGSAQAAAVSVPLGTAGSYAVLAGSTVTNTGSSVIDGDLGLSPGTAVTGFPPGQVHGTTHVADAAALQAEADLTTAYDGAAGEKPRQSVTGDLGGQTLTRGVYNSATSLGLTGELTLDGQGDPDSVWVFQAGSALTTATASRVTLVNGASPCNVFWQVGTSATLGTGSTLQGSVLALQSITVTTDVTVHGRVLARNGAVTLDTDTITRPACATKTPTPTTSPTASPTPSPTSSPTPAPTPTPSGPTGGTTTPPPGQITQVPSGPPATGDGGSVTGSHPILAATGVLALLASMAAVLVWRREDDGA